MNAKDIRVGQIIARRRNGQGPRRAVLVERIEQTRAGGNVYYLRGRSARISDLVVTGCREGSMMIHADLDEVELLQDAPEVTEAMRERQEATRTRMAADFTERWDATTARVREHRYGRTARECADRGDHHRAMAWLAEADKSVTAEMQDEARARAITPQFPEGTPEHTAYTAALKAELARWTAGEVATTPTPEYREWQRITPHPGDAYFRAEPEEPTFAAYLQASGADTITPRTDCSDPDCAALATMEGAPLLPAYRVMLRRGLGTTHLSRDGWAALCGGRVEGSPGRPHLTEVDCLTCLDAYADATRQAIA